MTTKTNSTESARNSRKQPCSFGMKKHQTHNLTGNRRNSGKIKSIYTKEKLKMWDDEIKLNI
jgi:hypothetical protein